MEFEWGGLMNNWKRIGDNRTPWNLATDTFKRTMTIHSSNRIATKEMK